MRHYNKGLSVFDNLKQNLKAEQAAVGRCRLTLL